MALFLRDTGLLLPEYTHRAYTENRCINTVYSRFRGDQVAVIGVGGTGRFRQGGLEGLLQKSTLLGQQRCDR